MLHHYIKPTYIITLYLFIYFIYLFKSQRQKDPWATDTVGYIKIQTYRPTQYKEMQKRIKITKK